MIRTTKQYAGEIREYQRVIDDLTMQLELAKLENERLVEEQRSLTEKFEFELMGLMHEYDALDQGRDEQDENHEGIIVEYLAKMQKLIDENKRLKEIVDIHDKTCLPSL